VSTPTLTGANGARQRMRATAFSAIMITGALMSPLTRSGIIEASITRKPNGRSGCKSTLRKRIANGFNKATAFCNAPTRVNNAPGFARHKRPFAQHFHPRWPAKTLATRVCRDAPCYRLRFIDARRCLFDRPNERHNG
jgi:hypothetical protein